MRRYNEKNAADLYEGFHRFEPREIGEFEPGFEIPSEVFKQGRAINVLYRSSKVDPETLKKPRKPVDYIHDHDSQGVTTHLVKGDGELVQVPEWIISADALTCLGQCLGFAFEGPDGKKVEAKGKNPLPELYAVQVRNGWMQRRAALLVVQSKREVIAIVWGGKLRVEPRGIVG